MSTWTATIEWRRATPLDAEELETLVEQLGREHSPEVRHLHGATWAATVSVEAPTLRQAIDRTIRMVEKAAHAKATGVTALRATEHDRRGVTATAAEGGLPAPRSAVPDAALHGGPGSPRAGR